MNRSRIRAVILAGGNSSRMGTPKEMLEWRGGTFLSVLVKESSALGLPCLVVSNAPERLATMVKGGLSAEVTPDLVPSAGPVSGIVTAFRAASEEALLILSCDLPFMDREQLEKLCRFADDCNDWDVAAANVLGRLHPLCAVYHRRTQPIWEQALREGQYRLMSTLGGLRVCTTPEGLLDEWAVFNANTPEDYQIALAEENRRNKGQA